MAQHIIQCRICKQKFDTEKEPFVVIGKQSYYHKSCYDEWVKTRNFASTANGDEDFWKESVIDYLYRDVKMSIDFQKINSQWANFTKPEKKMTPKGIYFALRYYYEVVHGDKEKSAGGIGIVSNIYNTAAEYWVNLENKKAGTIDAIVEQIKERQSQRVRFFTPKKEVKNKTKFNLDEV